MNGRRQPNQPGHDRSAWVKGVTVGLFALLPAIIVTDGTAHGTADHALGEFTAVTPSRVLDTRTGNGRGGVVEPLGEDAWFDVQITGRGGIPASGVAAVAMNVTVTGPTQPSYLTVWPTGATLPLISNLNYVAGQTVPNFVTVGVGDDGRVSAYNRFGTTHVVFDVVGFYADETGPPGSRFHPTDPYRLFDTRDGTGGVDVGALGPDDSLRFEVSGVGPVPASGLEAVVMNVTVTEPTEPSYLTVFPGDVAAPPLASNLNYVTGLTVPNLVTVRVPPSGVIEFYNRFGNVHVLADVVGFYDLDTTTDAGRFIELIPSRHYDSRWDDVPWLADEIWGLPTAGYSGVPLTGAGAVALNVTVDQPTDASFLTVFPSDLCEPPTASNLNFVAGQVVPNHVIVGLSTGDGPCPNDPGSIDVYNFQGSVHVIFDVFGFFTDDTYVFPDLTFTPVAWTIEPDVMGPGVHSVAMIAEVGPLRDDDLQGFIGTLRWDETEVVLCNTSVRGQGEDSLLLGDIFQTTECADAGLPQAVADYGLPETACLYVMTAGLVESYCKPLDTVP